MFSLAKKFLGHVLPGIIKPMHVLWNEIIGFVFFCLAVVAVPSTWRAVRAFDGDLSDAIRIGLTGLFGVVMLCFGISSFLRARRIGRS